MKHIFLLFHSSQFVYAFVNDLEMNYSGERFLSSSDAKSKSLLKFPTQNDSYQKVHFNANKGYKTALCMKPELDK